MTNVEDISQPTDKTDIMSGDDIKTDKTTDKGDRPTDIVCCCCVRRKSRDKSVHR